MNRLFVSAALPLFALASMGQAQQAGDFQLPPNPTPTPTPTVQGPVDSDSGPVRPRPILTPRPTPTPTPNPTPTATRPAPFPVPTPAPSVRPSAIPSPRPTVRATPRPVPPAIATPAPRLTPLAIPTPDTTLDLPAPTGSVPEIDATPSLSTLPPPVVPSAEPVPVEVTDENGSSWWWIVALAVLAAAAGAFAWARRGRSASVPRIEPPKVRRDAAANAGPGAGPVQPPLGMRFEALRLSRSMMAATLHYRITILNRGASALHDVALEADLGSASGAKPVDQQVASAATALTPRHGTSRLAAGQSARFEGSVQLPLAQADTIRQGNVALLVPLMRLRATTRDAEPSARTFAIGQMAAAGSDRMQPFRLDAGLRSYEPISQRALD